MVISPTEANVFNAGTGNTVKGTAGETLVAGEVVYLKAADSRLWKAITTNAATAAAVGVCLHGALAGQPMLYQNGGDLTINNVAVVGETYYVSTVAGDMGVIADVINPQYVTKIGMADATTNIVLKIQQTGVVRT